MMERVSWRYIFWMLASLGVFASMSVFGMLFWMTSRIDQAEHARTRDLLALSLAEKAEKLVLAVEDYAYWSLAYEVVRDDNPPAIYEHIGSGATQGELFDQIFILDATGQLLHAYDEHLGANAVGAYEPSAFKGVLSSLNEQPAEGYISVSSFVENRGMPFLVSAAWITPDYVSSGSDASYPVLVGVKRLDANWLSTMAQKAQVNLVNLTSAVANPEPGAPLLKDATGQPVAALSWDTEYSGTRMRREVMPGLILLCLGLLGICASAARYFHTQHKSLERANEVAIKDQLTGLLNRAGLEALLRRKEVARRLKDGQLAAIYIDLNLFKKLNDMHGHNAGDIALKVTAERLQGAIRKTDFVARLGGDEFLCVIIDDDPEASSVAVAERFISLSKAPVSFADHEQVIASSVGISIANSGTQWETLLSQSDAAMYWSKKKNADRPVVFCKSMHGREIYA